MKHSECSNCTHSKYEVRRRYLPDGPWQAWEGVTFGDISVGRAIKTMLGFNVQTITRTFQTYEYQYKKV